MIKRISKLVYVQMFTNVVHSVQQLSVYFNFKVIEHSRLFFN